MQFNGTRICKGSRATAWQVATNVEHWPEWTASVTRIQRLGGGPVHVGSRARVEQPGMQPLVWTVTRVEPEQRFDWETRTAGIRIAASHLIEPSDDGVVITNGLGMNGWLAALVAPFIRNRVQRFIEMETEGWKRRSETIETGTTSHAD
ncbi:MAG: SRPBCC family protein [Rhodanobacteraceae bacterium]